MFFKKVIKNAEIENVDTTHLPSQAYIITEIIKGCHYDNYLELGIYHGTTFNYIKNFTKKSVGVDCEEKDFIEKDNFFCMKTDVFFNINKEKFDAIFIDACHEYKQVRIDFENSMRCLKKGGTIFLHDTDPYTEEYMGPLFCNDSYKMNKYLELSGVYQFVTIPMDECGLTIVRKKNDNRFEDAKQVSNK